MAAYRKTNSSKKGKQKTNSKMTVINPTFSANTFNVKGLSLAGVVQWIEPGPSNQRVTSLIPSQGTYLGCRPAPQLGVRKGQPHTDVSLPLFLLPFPLSKKINK